MDIYEAVHEFQRKVDERAEITKNDVEQMFHIVCETLLMEHRILYAQMKSKYERQRFPNPELGM